jgi:hypothetical protein
MNYTPEQISQIVLKVLKEVETPDILGLSTEEKVELLIDPNTSQETLSVLATDEDFDVRNSATENPNYKKQTLELSSVQYDALKKLIESGQDEVLKGIL